MNSENGDSDDGTQSRQFDKAREDAVDEMTMTRADTSHKVLCI